MSGIRSALSSVYPLNPNHPLVQRVQRETTIQDLQLAVEYTRQIVDMINEEACNNPEEVYSLFRALLAAADH